MMLCFVIIFNYHQTSNVRCTFVGNIIIVHLDVIGAPVGAAPATSSFSAEPLGSVDWAEATARRDQNHLSFGLGATYTRDFMVLFVMIPSSFNARDISGLNSSSYWWNPNQCSPISLTQCGSDLLYTGQLLPTYSTLGNLMPSQVRWTLSVAMETGYVLYLITFWYDILPRLGYSVEGLKSMNMCRENNCRP